MVALHPCDSLTKPANKVHTNTTAYLEYLYAAKERWGHSRGT